jgi:hypothetical protein
MNRLTLQNHRSHCAERSRPGTWEYIIWQYPGSECYQSSIHCRLNTSGYLSTGAVPIAAYKKGKEVLIGSLIKTPVPK